MTDRWIQDVHPKVGALHQALHVPMDQPIPLREEMQIHGMPIGGHVDGIPITAHLKKEVQFALNVRKK
jgi:hypothetical protein